MIGIIDYGRGNLRSVANALNEIEEDYAVVHRPDELEQCERLILPGVGAFADCMGNLNALGLKEAIEQQVQKGKLLLGICLGMQMLFEESFEKGNTKGFGFLKGKVVRIDDPSLPIPEIGWNSLLFDQKTPLEAQLSEHPFVYYVHSYYAQCTHLENLIAHSDYGSVKVAGIVRKDNVIGTQFHPEKSGEDGLKILSYFAKEPL